MKRIVWMFFVFWIPVASFGVGKASLPSWHWAYTIVEYFQGKGMLSSLFLCHRPFLREDVAKSLLEIEKEAREGRLRLSLTEKKLLKRLLTEFDPEIQELQEQKNPMPEFFQPGVHLQSTILQGEEKSTKYRGTYRTRLAVPLGKSLVLWNAMNFDQNKLDDSLYVGKKWRGIAGFTEQAYLSMVSGRFRCKIGRDFLRWGVGRRTTLLFSDRSRPLDQLMASAELGLFRYSFLTAKLDDWKLSRQWADSLGNPTANRFVSSHRLDARLAAGKVHFGITETIIYGGVHRNIEWAYLNPFLSFHGEQMNQAGEGNTLGSVDLLVFLSRNFQWYGSLLIDDLQVEKTGPGDLEPSEWGMISGFSWADPFLISGALLFGEYGRVANRTYKTPREWETFLHRNEPLGYLYGNDVEVMALGWGQWMGGKAYFEIGFSSIRKGEGRLFTPWDAPWKQCSLEEGYTEPFPTGVVEKTAQWTFRFQYFFQKHWGLEGEIDSRKIKNVSHQLGKNKEFTNWKIGIWVDGDWKVSF